MAEEKTTLTTEEMMEKINELSKKVESFESENMTLKESNDKNTESLRKAREINSELLLRIGVPEAVKNEPEKEETFDDLVKETIDKAIARYHLKTEESK